MSRAVVASMCDGNLTVRWMPRSNTCSHVAFLVLYATALQPLAATHNMQWQRICGQLY